MMCDATIQRVVWDEGSVPIDVGRKSRTATDAQWQAIRSIYRTCAWDGCDRPLSWCQIHHILEWEHDGPTDMANLIPLCNHHHHQVHEGRWTVKLEQKDRRLDIYTPNGTHAARLAGPARRPTGERAAIERLKGCGNEQRSRHPKHAATCYLKTE